MTTNNQMDEVHHTISGVKVTSTTTEHAALAGPAKPAAIIGGIDMVPLFSPPPVSESANTARADERTFSEPTFFSRTDLIQVYTTSSKLFTTIERNNLMERDDGATLPTEYPTSQSMTTRQSHLLILPSSSLTKTPMRQRPNFDIWDLFSEITTIKTLVEAGYYHFLNQHDLQSPLSKDVKRNILLITA